MLNGTGHKGLQWGIDPSKVGLTRHHWGEFTTHRLDCFTVSLHSQNGRHLPAVRAVQGDCRWPLKNGGNCYQLCEPRMHYNWGISQPVFISTNYKEVIPANSHIRHSRADRALLRWRKECGRLWVQLASAVKAPMHSVAYMYIDSF